MKQPEKVTATFYIQVTPEWRRYVNSEGERELLRAKVTGLTQQRPKTLSGGTVAVKLSVQLPAGAFLPLRPEAIVVIPESMTVTTPIEVVALDANDVTA